MITRVLFGISVLFGGVLVPALGASAQTQLSTPTTTAANYLQDSGHSSSSSDPIGSDLTKLWNRDLGGLVSYPLIVDGRVFVVATDRDDAMQYLLCLDARTGVDLWTPLAVGNGVGSIAYDSGRVFVVSPRHVDAVSASTGSVLWSRFDLLHGDTIPVVSSGQVHLVSEYKTLVLDGATGNTVRAVGAGLDTSTVALTDAVQVHHQRGHHVAAFDRSTNRQIWEASEALPYGSLSSVARIGTDAAWAGSLDGTRAYDLATGAVRTRIPGGPLAVSGDAAYVAEFGPGGEIGIGPTGAYDAYTGTVRWRRQQDPAPAALPPLVTRDHVFTLLSNGDVTVLDKSTGSERNRIRLTPPTPRWDNMLSAMAVGQGLLLVPNGDHLTALGSSRTTWPAPRSPYVPPGLTPAPAATGADTSSAVEYAQGRGHNGVATGSTISPTLTRAWSRDFAASSYPLIVGDGVFVVSREGTPAETVLRRLAAADGRTVWGPVSLGDDEARLALDGSTLAVTTARGRVLALDASTGAIRWDHRFSGLSLRGPPGVRAGTIYQHGSNDYSEYALTISLADGALLTSNRIYSGCCGRGIASDAERVYYAIGGSTSYAFALDGTPTWARNKDSGGSSLPVLSGSRLFLNDDFGGLVLDTATGNPVSAFHANSRIVVADSVVYGVQSGRLVAEAAGSRTRHWSFAGDGTIDHAPVYANGYLIVVGASGRLWMLDASTGQVKWQHDTGQPRSPVEGYDGRYDYTDIPTVGAGGVLIPLPSQLQFFRATADPAPTEPDPADPDPTDPTPGDPDPSDPTPGDPDPTDPGPTEPTDPDPAEPDPTEPTPPGPAPGDPGTPPQAPAGPAARSIDGACPPGRVPGNPFADVPTGSTHERAISCLVWWQVANGRTPTSYAPAAGVSRGAMASFVARAILKAKPGSLADNPADAFGDDEGSVHQQAINQLAAAGIVGGTGGGNYNPTVVVNRGQMARFLANAGEHVLGSPLPLERDLFSDDNISLFQDDINRVAQAGLTGGQLDGTYNPTGPVQRDQMGSFLARTLDLFVAHGARPPA